MNGRDILNRLLYSDFFYIHALAFEKAIRNRKYLKLDNSDTALEFLTLCSLSAIMREEEYLEHDLDKLFHTYNLQKSTLMSKNYIALSKSKKFYLILRDDTCFLLEVL